MTHRLLIACLIAVAADAAKGRLVLETDKPDGTDCSATVEVRKAGQTAVVKTFATSGGVGHVDLDPGRYEIKATGVSGYWATQSVTIDSGKVHERRIELDKPPSAPAPATGGTATFQASATASGKTLKGKVTKGGHPAEGAVVVYRESGRVAFAKGAFEVKDLAKGTYRVEVLDKTGKKVASKPITIGDGAAEVEIELE